MPLAAAIYMHSPWTPALVVPAQPAGQWARKVMPPFPRDLFLAAREWLKTKIEAYDNAHSEAGVRSPGVEVPAVDVDFNEDLAKDEAIESLAQKYAHLKRKLLERGGDVHEESK